MADSNPSTIIFISDNQREIHQVRQWSHDQGYHIKILTLLQWQNGFSNPQFRSALMADIHGEQSSQQELTTGQVVPFPSSAGGSATKKPLPSSSMPTINDVQKKAIQETISEFHGNLTKASFALGIGRATLYRKVKQYNIDLSRCRRSKHKILKAA